VSWFASLSILIALPLFATVFAAVAIFAHSLFRRFVATPERLSEHHEVAGFLMGVVGVLYSVVLGFLVGAVWTGFSAAQQTADLEAGYVSDAFNFAGQLRSPQARGVQRLLARYAIVVRSADWSAPPSPNGDLTSRLLGQAVRLAVASYPPRYASSAEVLEQNTIRSALIDSLRSIGDTRRLRLVQSRSRLPAGMLEALILGAAAVIVFTFFFGVRSYAKQMIMTALVAGTIGLFFGLVIELSTPYSGSIQVSRSAWTVVIQSNRLTQFAK
jgi:hypothetical protein